MKYSNPPIVMHLIYRLAMGGLENGVVNLINRIPSERFSQIIVSLTDSTEFRDRIQSSSIPVISLKKREGKDFGIHAALWKIFRQFRPDIVHTRNFSGLEYLITAAMAGIPCRIHGEHGLDMSELDGSNLKYNLLRKLTRPFVNRYLTVSQDLAHWLTDRLGIPPEKVTQIYNGVDIKRFHPPQVRRDSIGPKGFVTSQSIVIGTVGRMQTIKDPLTLVGAFLHLLAMEPSHRERLRLVMIGDGPLRSEAFRMLRNSDASHLAWLPGERNDVPDMLRGMDIFVLPSRREGISNTVLEAMGTALPVIATRVGGNPELVEDGKTGMLVPSETPEALAAAAHTYISDPIRMSIHGKAGRDKVETKFSLEAMINQYMDTYDSVLRDV